MTAPHLPAETLEAWLSGALAPDGAAGLEAHVGACAECARALGWLRAERAWMAQRARRTPARPALAWERLEARLHADAAAPALPQALPPALPRVAAPAPSRLRPPRRWAHGAAALASAAAALLLLAVLPLGGGPVRLEDGEPEALRERGVEACVDPAQEALAALERRLSACLLATPVLATVR